MTFDFGGEIVWRPTPEVVSGSNLARVMAAHGIESVDEFHRRSSEDLEWFWNTVLSDLDIQFYEPYTTVLGTADGLPWAHWCLDGKLNIVHNCIDKRCSDTRVAIRWEGEEGACRALTYSELAAEVNRTANALRGLGIGKGDLVALFMPMVPEIAVAFFAIAKIGAIVLPLFSGYGSGAVATRLRDADVKCLVTCDGCRRRGQIVTMKETADAALGQAPSVKHVVVVRRLGRSIPFTAGRDHWWDDLLGRASAACETERTSAEDPFMVIYTSGTTGRPKGAVHTHCGFPVKAAQDLFHCFDLKAGDTMFWITDLGWMMGPWQLLGATLLGATMVLYDGALDVPGPDRVWSLVERHRVTLLGVSPTLIRVLMQHGDAPVDAHDLSSLRVLGSTGEPWNPDPWRWLFEKVGKRRLPIINYSGGTEISGGILSGNVLTPMKPCAFSGPIPGMAADVVDASGRSIRNQIGELVIRQPWIGMTRGFWNDPDRYIQTYWERIPDVWVHGDWAAVDEDGLWYILGRSDETIKIAGKRVGPAEIESILVAHPAVGEAAAVGVPDRLKGEKLVCFCVLRPSEGHAEDRDALEQELKDMIVHAQGKSLRPDSIQFVADLPKTRNAKIMRRVIRAAYLGEEPGDLSALENPSSVDDLRRLRSS